MGFLSKILSLAPTIGQIIGSFAGSAKAENGDGYVGFFFSGDEQGDVNLAKACFKKEADGTIHALNTATDKNDYVTMCFQGQGPTAPETIRIPGFTDLDVTQVFSRHARAKDDAFRLSTTVNDPATAAGANEDPIIVLEATAYGVPVVDANSVNLDPAPLGSYLSVLLTNSTAGTVATIAVVAGSVLLAGIKLLTVCVNGRVSQNVMASAMEEAKKGKEITLKLEPLETGVSVDLHVTAQATPTTPVGDYLRELDPSFRPRELTGEDIQRLQSMKLLNL